MRFAQRVDGSGLDHDLNSIDRICLSYSRRYCIFLGTRVGRGNDCGWIRCANQDSISERTCTLLAHYY